MKTLFYIRMTQFLDIFIHSGYRKKFELFLLFCITFTLLWILLFHAALIFFSIPVLLCLFIQLFRKDQSLIKKTGIAPNTIYSAEYLFLSFPFLITAVFLRHFEYVLILILFLFVLPLITPKIKKIL
jgi:hypothetical protein